MPANRDASFVDDLAQNIVAAERLGMAGVVHREAEETAEQLSQLLGVDVRRTAALR